tara:strand:- start:1143 stop:1673 length:531 start_codon:yes stop_codon:yes gene_type:complete
MGYSKESERQNKVLGDLLSGKTPEKRVMVGYEGKKEKKGDRVSKMTELMQEARMPLFCKSCKKVMNKKLDDKMWNLYGHCFDCQVKFEHKLRLEGKYEEWENQKILKNKISFIKEQIQAIEEWRDMKAPEWFNNVGVNHPELEKEKWDVDTSQIKSMADEALEEYNKTLVKLEEQL